MMNKKFLIFFLCAMFAFSLAACSGADAQDVPANSEGAQEPADRADKQKTADSGDTAGHSESGAQEEAALGPDATDEELLELLGDDVHVVTDDDYIKMVTAFTENTDEYAGQIYQLEGSYTINDGTPYIARTIVDGNDKTTMGMPLKYLPEEPKEGSWIRITGVISEGEVNGKTMAVLEVAVSETLEEQGQAEILRQ